MTSPIGSIRWQVLCRRPTDHPLGPLLEVRLGVFGIEMAVEAGHFQQSAHRARSDDQAQLAACRTRPVVRPEQRRETRGVDEAETGHVNGHRLR